ncbi:MAG: Rrf2 family transcriptional regulator [Lachnospiraceae bacterium]|nr:Rrf2 family transcriptional regulator [Lachnospiraceae bacterium]
MLISTKGRYALRVLTDMAEHQADTFVPLKEVAARQEISEKYLESIVKLLVKEGILSGTRGKGGGYRLKMAPDQINVARVLNITEGSLAPVACLENDPPTCERMSFCRTLEMWKGLDEVINNYLVNYTIADLMRKDAPGDDYII